MKISANGYVAGFGPDTNAGLIVTVLLAAVACGGWATLTSFAPAAGAVERSLTSDLLRQNAKNLSFETLKPGLTGSYEVTGTDSDGRAYPGASILDIALAPSGALELEWDNGKQLGVGQVIGNTLAVACLIKGRTVILIMHINPDGSLSGNWLRRTDRGYKGTETWTRKQG
jgi:hypothetical protein